MVTQSAIDWIAQGMLSEAKSRVESSVPPVIDHTKIPHTSAESEIIGDMMEEFHSGPRLSDICYPEKKEVVEVVVKKSRVFIVDPKSCSKCGLYFKIVAQNDASTLHCFNCDKGVFDIESDTLTIPKKEDHPSSKMYIFDDVFEAIDLEKRLHLRRTVTYRMDIIQGNTNSLILVDIPDNIPVLNASKFEYGSKMPASVETIAAIHECIRKHVANGWYSQLQAIEYSRYTVRDEKSHAETSMLFPYSCTTLTPPPHAKGCTTQRKVYLPYGVSVKSLSLSVKTPCITITASDDIVAAMTSSTLAASTTSTALSSATTPAQPETKLENPKSNTYMAGFQLYNPIYEVKLAKWKAQFTWRDPNAPLAPETFAAGAPFLPKPVNSRHITWAYLGARTTEEIKMIEADMHQIITYCGIRCRVRPLRFQFVGGVTAFRGGNVRRGNLVVSKQADYDAILGFCKEWGVPEEGYAHLRDQVGYNLSISAAHEDYLSVPFKDATDQQKADALDEATKEILGTDSIDVTSVFIQQVDQSDPIVSIDL